MDRDPSTSTSNLIHNHISDRKKSSRIDSVALALASRTTSSTSADSSSNNNTQRTIPLAFSSSAIPHQSLACRVCGLSCASSSVSNKSAMGNELKLETETIESLHICNGCKVTTLQSSTQNAIYDDEPAAGLGFVSNSAQIVHRYNNSAGTLGAASSSASLEDADFAGNSSQGGGMEQEQSSSSPTIPSTGSSTPACPQDMEGSDNDEYHPPGMVKKTDSTRGGRGKGKCRKPTSSTLSRQVSSMRTRSGGKTPTTSYTTRLFDPSLCDEKPTGKKNRGNASKGKGNRGRKPTGAGGGRGSKHVSMYATALTAASRERREQRANSEGEGRKEEDGVDMDKEYIRTCVVTSVDDKFMSDVAMCLVCGSIGKDMEGSMITCACCAQSFHIYCVSMQDKLNTSVLKRGWRCLDCTVCEGCGSGEDESNLLLCDECDISYHIYCLDPPLECIPRGSWRCQWCSTCARCNTQVKTGSDLQCLEGYCEACYSLRKCPKCRALYEIGELILKCGRCRRWLHGRCEGFTNEEQAENAIENSFRCSFCRPQTFNGASSIPIVIDNVMVSKPAAEQIQNFPSVQRFIPGYSVFGENFGCVSRSISYEQEDAEYGDEVHEQLIANMFPGRGRGRGGGPGRRMLKIGVGGFHVRTPKSRMLLMGTVPTTSTAQNNEDEPQTPGIGGGEEECGSPAILGPNGKPKIRRPRKLKRPLLEDAYPAQLQESFFGVSAVDSRMLADQTVEEPILGDYKKTAVSLDGSKFASELSEHSAELLRNEQEMDMLRDIPLVDNIIEGLDIEGLDFTDLLVDGEDDEEEESIAAEPTVEPFNGEFNAGSTSSLVQQTVATEVFSPSSSSSIRIPSRINEASAASNMPTPMVMHRSFSQQQLNESGKLTADQQKKQSAAAITAERWEEDEPLGNKATKAAVLYANVHHNDLKHKYPVWTDRIRQINRVWRELNADKRQEFVEWARKNRASCPVRRRNRRTNSMENNTQQQQQPIIDNSEVVKIHSIGGNATFVTSQPIVNRHLSLLNSTDSGGDFKGKLEEEQDGLDQMPSSSFFNPQQQLRHHLQPMISQQLIAVRQNPPPPPLMSSPSPTIGAISQQNQLRSVEIQNELQFQEGRLEQLKKEKRAFAARQRLLMKKAQPSTPEEADKLANELQTVQSNLEGAKKAVQIQQKITEKCRQRFKQLGPVIPSPIGPTTAQTPMSIFHGNQMHYQILDQHQQGTSSFQQQEQHQQLNFHPVSGSEFLFHNNIKNQQEKQQHLMKFEQPPQSIHSPYDQMQPHSSNGLDQQTNSLHYQPIKGTRGRKRKKPLVEDQVRTPVLGGVPFTSLETQLEREVFDTLDCLLGIVTTNVENSGQVSDALLVRRILSQQHDQNAVANQPGTKSKKRRQSQVKARNQTDMNSELELIQERIKKSIESIPPIANNMEHYQMNDKHMLKFPDQSGLPDHEGAENPLIGTDLGTYSFPFMPDYYDELETVREYIDEQRLLPPTMGELCSDVDLDTLHSLIQEEIEQNSPDDQKQSLTGSGQAFCIDDQSLMTFLSTDQLANRSKIVKSKTLFGNPGPSHDVPLEPHWSRFEQEPRESERRAIVSVNHSSVISREQFVDSLKQIIGSSHLNITELDTPPYTHESPENGDKQHMGTEKQSQIPVAGPMNIDPKMELDERTERIACRHCDAFIPADKRAIEEMPTRLGISEMKEKIFFCSLQCYYKFLALHRIPLNVESLDIAERFVDTATVETLRQISADMFAKRVQAGLSPNLMLLNEHTISAVPSTSGNLIECSNLPRKFVIRASELAALMQHTGIGQERWKERGIAGYKWRKHGWNICDAALIQSFQRPQDDIKQKFAMIRMQVDKNRLDLHEDRRQCLFCEGIGDGNQALTGRLLNVDANQWVHVNCALWSAEVHVTEDGGLINVESALRRARTVECRLCGRKGASIRCYKLDCANKELAFHLMCAKHSHGHFVKDKTFFCAEHQIQPDLLVTSLDALRRLFVQRDENQLLSKIFSHSYQTEMAMRVGSLIFHRIGQLLPDQLRTFTTEEHIFPVGYRVTRLFWSTSNIREHVRYECTIGDAEGRPEFCVKVGDGSGAEYRGSSASDAWAPVLEAIATLRSNHPTDILRFFPTQISGECLYGFAEPAISKMLESLPGLDQLFTYSFKHGGTPLMDLPLAENPSGCARCEPCFRTLVKRRHQPIISNSPKKCVVVSTLDAIVPREGRSTRNSSSRFSGYANNLDQEMLRAYKASGISERMLQTPYLRSNDMAQLIAQYREMKREWKSQVYLARSKIQGLGLYAKKDLDMNQMIIEYIGEMIRNEICEIRQRSYIAQNRGEYMFRIDCDWVVDATMSGGPARYINHSCDPNCGTKILTINEEKKVVIFANRPIKAGEELTYDYQFDIEETSKKIPCLCGAPNCVKWMN